MTIQQEKTMRELLKLAEIGKAAKALAQACAACEVSIEDALPMVVALAEKELVLDGLECDRLYPVSF